MGVIVKKTFWVTLINMVGVLIAAISILFIQTSFLDKKEIGAIKVLNSVALLIYPFILLGLGSAVMKFHHLFDKNKKPYNQFITYALLLPLVLLSIFTILSFFLEDYIESVFFSNSPYLSNLIYLLPGILFYYTYTVLIESFLSVKTKIILPHLFKSIIERIYLIVLILLYAFNYINFNILLILYVCLFVLNSLILLIYLFKNLPFKFVPTLGFMKTKHYKEFNTFSLYIIFATLSGVIIAQIDTLMTGHLLQDLGKVGVYTVAFFMGMVIEIPKRPLVQISTPIIAENLSNGNFKEVEELYKKSSINLMIIGAFLFLLIWLNIDYIFEIIPNGKEYSEGKYVVLFIALSKLSDLSMGVNFEIIQYSKYYKWNIFLTPFLAVLTIGTNYFFILKYGIVGTAIATAITIFIYNIVRSLLVYYKLNMNAINYRHFILCLLIGAILFIASLYSFSNAYIGIIINSIIISILFIIPIYFLKLSNDLNGIVDKLIKKIIS
jgi:O-antigen/teichoic acid export membrane protein